MRQPKPIKSGLFDPTPNLLMRSLGNECYGIDVDYTWYQYQPSLKPIALFEWKHFNQPEINASLVKAQIKYANALRVPLFVGITFTKNELDGYSRDCTAPKMAELPLIYLIDGNRPAFEVLQRFEGRWFGSQEMVKLKDAVCCHLKNPYGPSRIGEGESLIPTAEPLEWQLEARRKIRVDSASFRQSK